MGHAYYIRWRGNPLCKCCLVADFDVESKDKRGGCCSTQHCLPAGCIGKVPRQRRRHITPPPLI
eukprot:2836136-Pyramimonas_sp.AAC.1